MKDKFTTLDYVKGDFKKECPVIKNAFDYIQVRGEIQPWDVQIEMDFSEPTVEDLQRMQKESEPRYTTIPDCEHDPIDVGFAAPKIVCKKCDKDL